MKRGWNIVKQHAPWLALILCIDGFAVLLLWLADVRAFKALVGVIVLASALLAVSALGIAGYQSFRRERAFLEFLNTPDDKHEEMLAGLTGPAETGALRKLGETLRSKERAYGQALSRAEDYEEYVEAWAHEIKTPLSLLTLLLDNHREELSENVGFKLDAIRSAMQEYVEQMLYYARLKSTRKDYLFERVSIRECVEEVLEDYQILLEEKGFAVVFCGWPKESTESAYTEEFEDNAYADRRGLHFILSQIISNAVKYSKENPRLEICLLRGVHGRILAVKDSGIGVRSCDLPHIFDKGFTGGGGEERRKATGMGLYLARGIAQEMNVRLEAESEQGKGFEMRIVFPVID